MEYCRAGHERTPENTWVNSGRRWCKVCQRLNRKKYRADNIEKVRKQESDSSYRQLYGLTCTEDRDLLLSEQGNACAICKRTNLTWGKGYENVWAVDHEHGKEGTHRGVLCGRCNMALGKLEPYVGNLVAYLAKYSGAGVYGPL